MLKLENIRKLFYAGTPDETVLFDGFHFAMERGEFVSIIGSNGSGKTTLLNLVCGTVKPDGGKVLFGGRDVTGLKAYKRYARIGRVHQDPKAGSCADLTILENMALADNKGKPFGLGRAVNRKRAQSYQEMLARCGMGLEDRLSAYAGSLSGGQRQALALVIANMSEADLLILDEHTASLDPKSSETIMELTDRFVNERKTTALMVTHNLRHALQYGNRLVMMNEGKIVMDLRGDEKKQAELGDLLRVFNEISIEKGN